ncbi:hypothetical protein BLS_003164 [Venturia inaequalis]|nr:hypothetical protein BLS_003164 [Venturia inaequalis]
MLPKFFGKHGHVDVDPKKTKKDGGGKGNWGHPGDEIDDVRNIHMANPRRRSNSSSHLKGAKDFKTKFEHVEVEPVFEEHLHGPLPEDEEVDIHPLEHQSTISSDDSVHSIEEDK